MDEDSVGSDEWAQQCIFDANVGDVYCSLTDALLATYTRDVPATSTEALDKLRSEGSRQVCQYQFRKNDIVWICKQCQSDETCVLCNDCFPFSNHEGHEVFFYHSQAGGCCDCGDPGAWDAAGFCHRHGRVHENPMKDLPSGLLSTGKKILECVAQFIEKYALSHAALFDIDTFLENPQPDIDNKTRDPLLFDIILTADDIHAIEELDERTVEGGFPLSPAQRREKINEVISQGFSLLYTGPYSVVSEFLINLRAKSDKSELTLYVVKSNGRETQDATFVTSCISWLYKMAEISDGMCALICSTFPVERLRNMMVVDCYLPVVVVKPLHELLLMMMADISFKKVIAAAYALALPETSRRYGLGIGKSEVSIFRISVQFLNRYSFVSDIVQNFEFLQNLAGSLLCMMKLATRAGAEAENNMLNASAYTLKHHVIKHRRYDAIFGDLKIIFILPTIPKIFCMNCLGTLLATVETMQYIDPQLRQVSWHVEYENDNWIAAFNIHLSFSSLFDGVIGWFGGDGPALKRLPEKERPTVNPDSDGRLAKYGASDTLFAIFRAIYAWHHNKMAHGSDGIIPTIGSREVVPLFSKPPQEFSFHILLHRFLSICIKECCRYPHHLQTLENFAIFLATSLHPASIAVIDNQSPYSVTTDPSNHGLWWFYALADYPLVNIMTASQIKLKMWTRNGVCMIDQLLNYQEYPFCRIFRDVDVLLYQFVGTVIGPRLFLQHIYNRYNVHSLLANKRFDLSHTDPPKCRQLLDEAFLNIIIFVTELPLPPELGGLKDRGCSMDVDDGNYKGENKASGDDIETVSVDSISERVRNRAILRREVLHRLMAGSCSYSQLYETRSFLPGQENNCDDIVDNIVDEVGIVKKSGGMEETIKIYLNPEFWGEYDPCFYHVTLGQHQNILESKPRVKVPMAICPAPSEAHERFFKLRHGVLTNPLLLGYVRDLLYSFVALRFERELDKKQDSHTASTFPSEASPVVQDRVVSGLTCEQVKARKKAFLSVVVVSKPWVLQCTDATYLKCVQILTLLVHHLEYLVTKPVSPEILKDIEVLSNFALYSPHTLVSPPMAAFLDSVSDDSKLSAMSVSSIIQQQLSAFSSPGMSGVNTGMNSIYASAVNSNSNSASNSRRPSIDGNDSIVSGVSTVFDYNQPAILTGINIAFTPVHGNVMNGIVTDNYMIGNEAVENSSSQVSLSLPSLLVVMLMAHDMLLSEDDIESRNYMRWCLDKLRVLLPVCDKIIVDWMKAQLDNERDAYMKAKRAEAREKITEKMKSLTLSFMASPEYLRNAKGHSVKLSRDEMEDSTAQGTQRLCGLKRSDGGEMPIEDDECIICRGNNENAGAMVFLMHSHLVKDVNCEGAYKPHIATEDIAAAPQQAHLQFRFCGHAMHLACFDSFYPQVVFRSNAQHGLLIDTTIGEFQCPLCKMLSNAVVPVVNIPVWGSDNIHPDAVFETNRSKIAKLDTSSNLEDVDSPVRGLSQMVSWITKSSRQGILFDYEYPLSLCMPVSCLVPLSAESQDGTIKETSLRGSWISRAMSSFPIKLFEKTKAWSAVSEFDVSLNPGQIPFILPRPDDLGELLEDSILLRQSGWLLFLSNFTNGNEKMTPGQMKDSRILDSIAVAMNGVTASISVEASESFPGHHLIGRTTMGMDQLKAVRGVTDVLGLCLSDFYIAKGVHQALMSAIFGDTVNVLWMADNSIPVSDSFKSAAVDCVESALDICKRDSMTIEPLVLTARRAIQLYATCLGGTTSSSGGEIFVQPLLARPLLDTLVLAVMLHRTYRFVNDSDCKDGKNPFLKINTTDASDDAVAGSYLERNVKDKAMRDNLGLAHLTEDANFSVICKWIALARLSQLTVMAATKDVLGGQFDEISTVTKDADLPLVALVRQMYDSVLLSIGGRDSKVRKDNIIETIIKIILDWLMFLRSSIHLLLRCHFDAKISETVSKNPHVHIFNYRNSDSDSNFLLPLQQDLPSKVEDLTAHIIMDHLAAFDILELLEAPGTNSAHQGTNLSAELLRMNDKWLQALVFTTAPTELLQKSLRVYGTCDLAPELGQHVFGGSLCDSLYHAGFPGAEKVYHSFVSTGFVGYLPPDWAQHAFAEIATDISVAMQNATAVAVRMRIMHHGAPKTLFFGLAPRYRRQIYEFPKSYTMFHQQIRSMCDHEYPAVCLTCGRILNAGGKAECTKHAPKCNGDSGAFFLLQDCQVLLCYHSRASYFPAPFIDDHGEKHRQFRGKPLHLDKKRFEILRALIATGGIANEVIQKRSTSSRVIIANHY